MDVGLGKRHIVMPCMNHICSYTPNPQQWREQFWVLWEGGLPMTGLVGATCGSTSGLQNHHPHVYNRCRFSSGVSKVWIPLEICQGYLTRQKAHKENTNNSNSRTHLAKPMEIRTEMAPHPSKHNPPHTKSNHPKRALRKSKWKNAWHQHKQKQPNTMWRTRFLNNLATNSLQIHQHGLEICFCKTGSTYKVLRTL